MILFRLTLLFYTPVHFPECNRYFILYINHTFLFFLIEGFLNFLGWELKKIPLSLILFIIQTWQPILGNSNKSGFLNHIPPHMVLIYLCLAFMQHSNRCWTFLIFNRPLILWRSFSGIGRNIFLSYRSFTRLSLMKFVLLTKWISSLFQIFWFYMELYSKFALGKNCND